MMKGIIGFAMGTVFTVSIGLNCVALIVLYGLGAKAEAELRKAAIPKPKYCDGCDE